MPNFIIKVLKVAKVKASSKFYSLQTKTYKALKTKTIILLNQIKENTSVKSKVFIEFTLV